MMAALGLLAVLVIAAAVVVAGVRLLLPAVSQAAQQCRIDRDVAEASWRIHQRAAHAFEAMLKAARESEVG